jgi:hypothetical protein
VPDDKRYASLLGISYRVKGLGKYMGFALRMATNKRICNICTPDVSFLHIYVSLFDI